MSECVVRMKMPKRCDSCGLRFICKAFHDFCTTKEGGCSYLKVGMEGCLILCQLPEGHGRLGDLDALCEGLVSNHDVVIYAKSAPTIVPADTVERSET